ncbi:MAG: hypothetical protein U5P10_04620 [Spirochaetia bacterium]|nr:hypothetical protein [Spirochaetia bacterium]
MISILCALVLGTLPPLNAEEPQVEGGRVAEPLVEGGRLDLSDYSFEQQGPLKLDGMWRFVWREFLEPPSPAGSDQASPAGSNEPALSDADQPAPARPQGPAQEIRPAQQPAQLIPVPGR